MLFSTFDTENKANQFLIKSCNMKKVILAFLVAALGLTGCQPSKKKEDSKCDLKKECCSQEKECNQERKKCCSSQPMVLNSFETIKLTAPKTDCKAPLMEVAQNRKSDRNFAETNLSLEDLSNVLWMANGVNREDGKRTVPSAMAMYPLETYAVLSNGIYRYDPAAHQLIPVLEGDHRNLTGLQDFVYNAPLNLVFIADYSTYIERKMPENKWLYLAALDAGHCTQNVYLYCAGAGLKVVVRAGAKEKELLEALNLDPKKHQFIVAQTVGY